LTIIDGRGIARRRQEVLHREVARLEEKGIVPTIAPILVGEEGSARVYYRAKARLAEKLGIRYAGVELPTDTREEELLSVIASLNVDPRVDGIFIELPLPRHISWEAVSRSVVPEKDIDGINPMSMGLMLAMSGRAKNYRQLSDRADVLLPATPMAVMEILLEIGVSLAGSEAVVIGRSLSVGRPLSLLLLTEGATVTICHSKTRSIDKITRRADVLCVAVGRSRFLTSGMVKQGAVIVDIGINVSAEGIVGDVDYEAVATKASLITPVPGGVGPMTTTMIMANTVKCALNRA